MFRFLFGVFTGLWIGFAAGFVAGLWLMIREIKDSEPSEGTRELYLAGEIEWNFKNERLIRGIPLLTSIVEDLETTARDLGLNGTQLLGV